jgi:hypothetical protein
MHDPVSPILSTLALLGGIGLCARSFRELRLRQLIQNTPTARIRSLAMGLVEINGRVEANNTLTAPFSGRPCAYWEVDIATQGRRRPSWRTVHRNTSGHPFYLRDDTGLALVYPKGARCNIPFGTEQVWAGFTLPECYASYLKEQGIGTRWTPWGFATMRFRERTIDEGERVYVLGTATPRAQVVTISEGEVLQATGTEDHTSRRLRRLHEETAAVVRQGENEPAFIISEGSERQLTMELGFRALGGLIGGPALALLGLGWWLYALSTHTAFK